MERLIFHNEQLEEIHFDIHEMELAPSIRIGLEAIDEVRYACYGFTPENEAILKHQPLFFEWRKVEVIFHTITENQFIAPYTFYVNRHPQFSSRRVGKIETLSGFFTLENAVGNTDFEIRDAQDKVIFKLETEVFPQKMDYKEDFANMLEDISSIVYNLIYDYLQKTFTLASLKNVTNASFVEWRAILQLLFDSLENSLAIILRNPKTTLVSNHEVKEIHRIKRSSRNSKRWLLKNRKYLSKKEGHPVSEHLFATHLQEQKKQISYNTFENRFVVWALKQLLNKIELAVKTLQNTPRNPSAIEQEIKTLTSYRYRLRRHLNNPILQQVEPFENQRHSSNTLTMAPGYKDFYKHFLLLQKGLSIFDDDFYKIDYKKISLLYEYWCFLKIVQTLKDSPEYNLVTNDLIQVDAGGFSLKLRESNDAKIEFEHRITKDRFSLFYNRTFSKKLTHTYNQKPDYTIQFKKHGYKKQFTYWLDAKYRFARGTRGKNELDAPQDAIGQLHKYRDSILLKGISTVDEKKIAWKSMGGVILYPYPKEQEEFRNNKFYKSIKEVNIGALPLLPRAGGDKLLKEFLDNLLAKTPEQLFENDIVNDRSEYEKHQNQMNTVCVIGMIRKKEYKKRYNFFKKNNCYLIRYINSLKSPAYQAKHVILYSQDSGNIIAQGKVKHLESISKKELIALGVDWALAVDKYLLLKVDKWQSCRRSYSGMKQLGFRYTSYFAFTQFLKSGDDNQLLLNSFASNRLWQELTNLGLPFSLSRKDDTFKVDRKSALDFKLESGLKIRVLPDVSECPFRVGEEELSLREVLELIAL